MEDKIIYLDNHILVVNKSAGLLTQPSGTSEDSLENQCKQWLKQHFAKPGNVFLEAVHRLDRGVSGLVVFAKTSKALSRLNESQRSHHFQKTYRAIVEGSCPSKGILENYLVHDDYSARVVETHEKKPIEKDAKYCRLDYRLIQKSDRFNLLEIELKTGRYHQIRAQLAHAGWPVLGDQKYGSSFSNMFLQKDFHQIALHHFSLVLVHPITKEKMEWSAPFSLESHFF